MATNRSPGNTVGVGQKQGSLYLQGSLAAARKRNGTGQSQNGDFLLRNARSTYVALTVGTTVGFQYASYVAHVTEWTTDK